MASPDTRIVQPNKGLVVSYEPAIARLVERALMQGGFKMVEITHTTDQARTSIATCVPGIIITDWNKVGGIEVINMGLELQPPPRIILMNGGKAATEEIRAKGVQILEKPFDYSQLVAAIKSQAA